VVESDAGYAAWLTGVVTRIDGDRFHARTAADLSRGVAQLIAVDTHLVADNHGLSAVRQVLAQSSGTPILVVSDVDDQATAIAAVREGVEDYLVKRQINETVLTRVVRYAVERRLARLALGESEARFRRLTENAPDIIYRYEVHPRAGLTYVSPAVTAILGYTPSELYARTLRSRDVVDPADYARLKRMLTDQPLVEPVAVRMRHKNGRLVWTEHRAVPIYGPDGSVVAVEGIVRDMTERRQMEAQLAQAERLHSLGVMASGMAHQMNNMLQSVLGHADLLLTQVTTPEARENVDAIIRAAEDGAASVARIQTISHTSPHRETATLDLVALVHEAVETTAPRWRDQAEREGRVITVSVGACPHAWVRGVAAELREALTNLVLNAVDALPDGGSIRLSVADADGNVVVSVQDTGTGMPDEVIEHAFDPFFTTKSIGTGTGLGLAITHGIVRRHDGAIAIQSEPGMGTRVEITLPCAPAPSDDQPGEEWAASITPLRVLVVDDNPDLGQQLGRILRLDGHAVDVCREGPDVITALERTTYDVVITDLGMPGLTGWEVACEAKRLQPEVRVVLVTGWGNELQDADILHQRGVDVLISKPYRIETIRSALAAVPMAAPDRD
jgi:PAS domain S-box-containing protein